MTLAIGPGPESVAISIYAGDPGGGDWDEVNWDAGVWAGFAWLDVGCQVLEAVSRWGSAQEFGVLTLADAGELDLSTYDPDRILDPLNDDSPLFGALVPGRPVRVNAQLPAGQNIVGAGFIDSAEYDLASGRGRIRAVDGVAMLAQAQIAEGVSLPDTLRARVRAVVAAAGLGEIITVEAESPELGPDPPVATWPIPNDNARNAWAVITDAATDALVYVWVDPSSVLRFADFGSFPAAPFAIGCPPGSARATETTTPIGIASAGDDSCLESRGTSQAAAADGTGGQFVDRGGQGSLYAGQTTAAGTYYAYQSFVRFDTRAIPADATITSVLLETSQNDDSSVTDFSFEARAFDWTPPVVTANWRSRAQLAALPLRASVSTLGLPAAGTLFTWTSDPSFAAGINRGGWTGLVICSSRVRAGTVPTGNEYAGLRAFELGLGDDPLPTPRAALAAKLTVTWIPAGPLTTWLQGLSTLTSTFAGDGIRNSVRAQSGGVFTDPIVDTASQALYGPRPFDVPRLPPDLANWSARILADRADAAYTVALGELRPYSADELALIVELGLQGASSVRVRDDAHGPLIDYTADIVGAQIGVSAAGWVVHYATMMSAAAVLLPAEAGEGD